MSDPTSPNPVPSEPPPVEATTTTVSPAPASAAPEALQPHIAAALSCIPLVGGIIFLILEKKNKFVRFYAAQSLLFTIACILWSVAFTFVVIFVAFIPGIRVLLLPLLTLISWLVGLGILAILVVTIAKALSNKEWEIPYIGPIARKQLESGFLAKF